MSSNISFSSAKCARNGHNQQPYIGFCIDPKCKEQNKFICQECFFEGHAKHDIVKLDQLEQEINKQLENETNTQNQKKELEKTISEEPPKLIPKFDDFKAKIDNYIDDFKTKYIEYYNSYLKNDGPNTKDNDNFNMEGLTMATLNEQIELSKKLQKFYSSQKNEKNKRTYNLKDETNKLDKKIKDTNTELDKSLNDAYDIFSKNLNNVLENFNKNIEKNKEDLLYFSWRKSNYYEVSKDSLQTKKISGNSLDVCFSDQKLDKTKSYYIEFALNYQIKSGEIYIGIGTEKTLGYNWENCYLITQKGLFGKINKSKKIIFKNNDIVSFEINFTNGKKCIAYINSIKYFEFSVNLQEDVYAIFISKNVGNGIILQKFNNLE